MRDGLLVNCPVRLCMVGLCLAGMVMSSPAQDAELLAIPVRKNVADEKPVASRSTKSDTGKNSKVSAADIASISNLRDNSSFYTLQPKETATDSVKKSESRSTSEKAATASASSSRSSGNPRSSSSSSSSKSESASKSSASTSKKRETASSSKSSDESRESKSSAASDGDADTAVEKSTSREMASVPAARQLPAYAPSVVLNQPPPQTQAAVQVPAQAPSQAESQAAAPRARRTEPITNHYAPQAEENRGFLSRLLNRRKARQSVTNVVPTSFNSDHATRDNSVVLPAVLHGNGFNGHDLPIGGEDPYRFASLPATFRPTDLVKLPQQICYSNNQQYLRREAADALCRMLNAAARDGMRIQVVSAFRDVSHQTRLYNSAVARRGPDQKMVARPGRSEHNLGTTVDLTNSREHTLKQSFGNTPEGRWLAANCERFGFKRTVMSKSGPKPTDEPWHLRYFGSAINRDVPVSAIAQTGSRPQRRGVLGSVGRMLGLAR